MSKASANQQLREELEILAQLTARMENLETVFKVEGEPEAARFAGDAINGVYDAYEALQAALQVFPGP